MNKFMGVDKKRQLQTENGPKSCQSRTVYNILSITMIIILTIHNFQQADFSRAINIYEQRFRHDINSTTIGNQQYEKMIDNHKTSSIRMIELSNNDHNSDRNNNHNHNNQIENVLIEKQPTNSRAKKNRLLAGKVGNDNIPGLDGRVVIEPEFSCRDKLLNFGANLLEQHLRVLSRAADELLSEKARTFVSQLFMHNLRIFIELHCPVSNDAFQAGKQQASHRALGAAASDPDEWLEDILKLAFEAFGEVMKAPEEKQQNSRLNLNATTSSGDVIIINSTDSSGRAISEETTTSLPTKFEVRKVLSKMNAQNDSNAASIKPEGNFSISPLSTTKTTTIIIITTTTRPLSSSATISTNDPSASTTSITQPSDVVCRDFKVMAALRPRSLMLKLNRTMKIKYSEYVDNYSKRLLVFENATDIIVLVGASRYHLHGTSIYLFTWALLIVILMGNCYILISTRSCRRRRSNVNFFIVHLAIADLLVGIFSMCSDALIRYLRDFTFGYPVCVMYKYLSILFIFLSTYMLVALGFDRREAVVYPLQFASNRNRGVYLVSCAWLLSALLSSPILFLMQVVEVDSIRQCNIVLSRNGWKMYVLYMLAFVIIIPSASLIVFYSQIVRTINRKYRQAESMERRLERDLKHHPSTSTSTSTTTPAAATKSTLQIANEALSSTTLSTIEDVESSSDDGDENAASACDDDDDDFDLNNKTQCDIIKSLCCSASHESPRNSVHVTITLDGSGSTWNNKINTDNYKTHDDLNNLSNNNVKKSPKRGICNKAAVRAPSLARLEKVLQRSQQVSNDDDKSSRTRPRRFTGAMINRQHGKSIIPKARLKTIQMTIAIVIAFLVCWLPFYVVNIIGIFNLIDQKNPYWDMIMSYTNISCYLNSAMNPVLYFWFSRNNSDKTKNKPKKANLNDTSNK